jgi:hypothetical protein
LRHVDSTVEFGLTITPVNWPVKLVEKISTVKNPKINSLRTTAKRKMEGGERKNGVYVTLAVM